MVAGLPSAPEGAPNVVVVLLDDVGYAQLGCYGSDIATPTFDRLAADGLRYSQLPHHRAVLADACVPADRPQPPLATAWAASSSSPSGFPGYDATIPQANGFLSEILRAQRLRDVRGRQVAPHARRTRWRRAARGTGGRSAAGFERFYGFLGGETDQFLPDLVHDNHQVDPPRTPEEGYHLTEDLADQAIGLPRRPARRRRRPSRSSSTSRPGACHSPHQAPRRVDRARTAGAFDEGWDAWREEVFARQLAIGPAAARAPS